MAGEAAGYIAAMANPLTGLIGKLDDYQRRHPWLGFPFAVVKKFGDDEAGKQAALMAYYAFFSLFPLMLVMVTVLGFIVGLVVVLLGLGALSHWVWTKLRHRRTQPPTAA